MIEEQLLWKYIEGACDQEEQERVETAFESDEILKAEWQERRLLHEGLKQIEVEIPSMRFTQNLMDVLPKRYAYQISKRGLRNLCISVLTTAIATLAILAGTKSGVSSELGTPKEYNLFSTGEYLNQLLLNENLLFVGLMASAFLVLYFFDKYAFKKHHHFFSN